LRAALLHFESSRVSKTVPGSFIFISACFKKGVSLFQFGSFAVSFSEDGCFTFQEQLFQFPRTGVSVCKNGCFSFQERVLQLQ